MIMPFKPITSATSDDYPELMSPRRPWEEWVPQHQVDNMREILGDDLWEWLEKECHVSNNDISAR